MASNYRSSLVPLLSMIDSRTEITRQREQVTNFTLRLDSLGCVFSLLKLWLLRFKKEEDLEGESATLAHSSLLLRTSSQGRLQLDCARNWASCLTGIPW